MNRQYYPPRKYYPRNSSSSGVVGYESQFQPVIPVEILQQKLGQMDQRYRQAKRLPSALISEMNKASMSEKNRTLLSEHFNNKINDIQKTVEEEYNGDYGKAADFISDEVIQLQKYNTMAQQDYKETQPIIREVLQAQSKGWDVVDPNNVMNGGSSFEITEDGELKPTGRNRQLYLSNPVERNKYIGQISDAINKSLTTTDLQNVGGMGKYSTIEGMSDAQVESYFESNFPQESGRLQKFINEGPSNFERYIE